jgi:hypothetical protein
MRLSVRTNRSDGVRAVGTPTLAPLTVLTRESAMRSFHRGAIERGTEARLAALPPMGGDAFDQFGTW